MHGGLMTLRVTTITQPEDLASVHGEWLDLVARSGEMLPFPLPEWVTTWWRHFREDRPTLRDQLAVKLVRRADGQLVGVVPLMRTDRPGIGPLRLRVLGFVGADPYITEQPTPLVDPACAEDVAHACVRDLEEHRDWDWMHWRGLVKGSPFAETIERRMSLMWQASQPGSYLRLAPTWDAFRSGLKRNIKESLRHCYNSLKRDNVSFRFQVARTREEIPRALDGFYGLHEMRAKLEGTTTHIDRFGDTTARGFIEDLAGRLAARDAFRVFTVEIGGKPVASRIAFALPGTIYLYYSGVDPQWMKYSITTTLVAESIRYAIDNGFQNLHLSMGEDVSKTRWGPVMPVYADAIALRQGLTSQAKWEAYGRLTEARKHPLLQQLLPTRRSG